MLLYKNQILFLFSLNKKYKFIISKDFKYKMVV